MLRRHLFVLPFAAAGQPADTNARLGERRQAIDAVDDQIVDLLNRRADIVREVGRIKKQAHLPVAAPGREKQVLDRVAARAARGPLPPEVARNIYANIIAEMSKWEASLIQNEPK